MTMVTTVSDKSRKPRKDSHFYLEGRKPKDGIEVILNFFFPFGNMVEFHFFTSFEVKVTWYF